MTEIATPALIIDRARMESNIARMSAAMAAVGVALRPHFKTSKLIEVARLQLDAGAVGFTCATPEEVDALLSAGITDLFWAHGPVGAKARLAAEFNRRGRVAIGVDSVDLVHPVASAAEALGVMVPVRLEVDTGLGRTGVRPEDAVDVAQRVAALPGIEFEGVYTHEGQLASVAGDRSDIRSAGVSAGQVLVAAADAIREAGTPMRVVSVGSTPGWDSAPAVPGVTEARPGTYVFGDANQLRLESVTIDQCALTVLTSVVSTQRDGAVIVDAGIKAMSSDRSNRGSTFGLPLTADRELDEAVEFPIAYEEHGTLAGDGVSGLRVGDTVSILPNHACGVVNMWGTVHVLDDDGTTQTWHPVSRH
jgi:D-serine deaminase-like pyridoxal phosphate-dependent protein